PKDASVTSSLEMYLQDFASSARICQTCIPPGVRGTLLQPARVTASMRKPRCRIAFSDAQRPRSGAPSERSERGDIRAAKQREYVAWSALLDGRREIVAARIAVAMRKPSMNWDRPYFGEQRS